MNLEEQVQRADTTVSASKKWRRNQGVMAMGRLAIGGRMMYAQGWKSKGMDKGAHKQVKAQQEL